MDIKKRMEELAREILRHQQLYYVRAQPEISDLEYDRLADELLALEKTYPEFRLPNSPSLRVGSDLDRTFPEREHRIAVLSLDKEYTAENVLKWLQKASTQASQPLDVVVEEKIDGASIVLYYQGGELVSALTRGNGYMGNDVTDNVRTIRQVPLIIDYTKDLAVRGEIYLGQKEFLEYNRQFDNRYANPRNLAAGSLRNSKSALVAKIPLHILLYEGFFSGDQELEHTDILSRLKKLGFRINPRTGFFSDRSEQLDRVKSLIPGIHTGELASLPDYIREKQLRRRELEYDIDGLVIKINNLNVRREMGNTAHHPRWALAFKFDSPTVVTQVLDVQIQVGRNGRVTPVANLLPVEIAGSTVSRATLHNQEYIDLLELGIGDSVSISKRGDIIPAVEQVLEKASENPTVFRFPANCPFCGSLLVKDGAHHFCKNRDCPERIRRGIIHFAAKDQMDIETLGEKTVQFLYEKGFVRGIPDIYAFDYSLLLGQEGFKEKKINHFIQSVNKSKQQPFARVLVAVGFEGLGAKAVSLLLENGFDTIDKILDAARLGNSEPFLAIDGFGEITAGQVVQHFSDERNLKLIHDLRNLGLQFVADKPAAKEALPQIFAGQIWVITGSFDHFQPRSLAAGEIKRRGGKVAAGISGKTTHLLAGKEPGSKLDKAQKSGVAIVPETQFLKLLGGFMT